MKNSEMNKEQLAKQKSFEKRMDELYDKVPQEVLDRFEICHGRYVDDCQTEWYNFYFDGEDEEEDEEGELFNIHLSIFHQKLRRGEI